MTSRGACRLKRTPTMYSPGLYRSSSGCREDLADLFIGEDGPDIQLDDVGPRIGPAAENERIVGFYDGASS